MPAEPDPFADWPDRTTMSDESGHLTMAFSASVGTRDETPWADGVWVPSSVPTTQAVALALDAMPGWLFATSDQALAIALLAAGATERRHAHSMSSPLTEPPPTGPPSTVRVEPLSGAQLLRHAETLGGISYRAYPADHPDAFDGDQAVAVSQLRQVARGEILGPMLPQSRIALADGRIVGACLVVDRPGEPPHAGPWVVNVFRDPDSPVPGVGTALLTAALAAARDAGLPGLSLVVSHDNHRARRLYGHLGFVDVQESWTLALPKKGERPA